MYLKAFSVLVILSLSVDAAAFEGAYRRSFGHQVRTLVYHVSNLHWTGFIGR